MHFSAIASTGSKLEYKLIISEEGERDAEQFGEGGIGIGGAVTRSPLPHHRTGGSAYGGSVS